MKIISNINNNKNLVFNQGGSVECFLIKLDIDGMHEINFNESFNMIIKNKSLYIKFKSVQNLNDLKEQITSALKINPKLILNPNSKNNFLSLELIHSKHSLEFDLIDSYNKSIRSAMASILGIGVELMKCPEELVIVREDLKNMKTVYDKQITTLKEEIKVLKDIIDKLT